MVKNELIGAIDSNRDANVFFFENDGEIQLLERVTSRDNSLFSQRIGNYTLSINLKSKKWIETSEVVSIVSLFNCDGE